MLAWVPLVAVACDGDPAGPDLEDRRFLAQSVTEGGAPRALVAGTNLSLRFFESPRIGASAGCNSLDGTYEVSGGRLVVSDAGWTEIGCDPVALYDQETWYFEFLQTSPAITVDGDSLVLDGDGTRIEYLDEEVATPDLALVGPTWTVEAIIEGDTASATQWPTPATFDFSADGTVQVSTGCNGGTGTYVVDGTQLTFADVAVTERGCTDEATQMLEEAVLGVVHGPQPVTWEVTVTRLSLRGDVFGLDLRG
jgi:heat shock protein HslJ